MTAPQVVRSKAYLTISTGKSRRRLIVCSGYSPSRASRPIPLFMKPASKPLKLARTLCATSALRRGSSLLWVSPWSLGTGTRRREGANGRASCSTATTTCSRRILCPNGMRRLLSRAW
jgi:hypothetical protein